MKFLEKWKGYIFKFFALVLGLFGVSTLLSAKKSKEVKEAKKDIKKGKKKVVKGKKSVAAAKKKAEKAADKIAQQQKVIDDIKERKATGAQPTQKEAKEALDFLKDFTKDYKG
jgi:DNA-binding transcriptional regulator GbsR (MarR family)